MAKRKILPRAPNINPTASIGQLILRVVAGGAMFYAHGWPKLLKFFGEGPVKFADPFGIGEVPSLLLAIFAEVICSALILVGFWTRWATIPLIVTMLVALLIVHINDPFSSQELPLMYLAAYLTILLVGPGKISLDFLIKR